MGMIIDTYKKAALVFFLIGTILSGPLYAENREGDSVERQKTLVLGRVSVNSKEQIKYLVPIVDYIAEKMKNVGIERGALLFAEDNRQLITFLRQGKVDWVSETPFSATLFEEKADAEIMLLRWKKGVPKYSTIFIARKDSGIKSLADLKGKKIAFEDRGSTSGFFTPVSLLLQSGFDVVELTTQKEPVPRDKVGYIFSNDEINISAWVYRGITDAGAMSNLDWDEGLLVQATMKEELEIFYETGTIPRALTLVRRDLDPQINARLKEILLTIHEDPEAKDILMAYKNTARFQELDAETRRSLDNIRELGKYIAEELF